MAVTAFHPILYVDDPRAERDFYAEFGFETAYEGDEFPDFIAVKANDAIFGLSSNRPASDADPNGVVRWQLMVDDVDEIIAICRRHGRQCDIEVENPAASHFVRIAKVRSPNGVLVWFEGPNEAHA